MLLLLWMSILLAYYCYICFRPTCSFLPFFWVFVAAALWKKKDSVKNKTVRWVIVSMGPEFQSWSAMVTWMPYRYILRKSQTVQPQKFTSRMRMLCTMQSMNSVVGYVRTSALCCCGNVPSPLHVSQIKLSLRSTFALEQGFGLYMYDTQSPNAACSHTLATTGQNSSVIVIACSEQSQICA